MTEAEFGNKAHTLWLEKKELFTPVPMIRGQGGFSLVTGRSDAPVYFTKYFVEKVGGEAAASGKEIEGHTYRYYLPESGNDRGSGRDHLIRYGDRSASDAERLHAVKGSGINPNYSAVNGAFQLENFRKNGLQPLPESLAEFLMSVQYTATNVPLVPHTDFVIPPEAFQFAMKSSGGIINPETVDIQTHRYLVGGRESQSAKAVADANRKKVVGALYFWNIGHGALNPENLSGDGRILDMGHTGFVSSVMSGQYRCTICQSVNGGRYDKTMVGPLDHYFPGANDGRHRSLTFRMTASQKNELFESIIGNVKAHKTEETTLVAAMTEEESRVFSRLISEDISTKGNHVVMRALEKWDEHFYEALGARSENYYDSNVNEVVSMRFLMQAAGLKIVFGARRFGAEVLPFLMSFVKKEDWADAQAAVDLFERAFRQSRADEADLTKTLFTEYRPMNVLLFEIRKELAGTRSLEGIRRKSQALYNRLREPIALSPSEWWEKMRRVIVESGRPARS